MEQRFFIEAKSFCFSTKEGFSDFHLEERRKNFVGFIFASTQCSSWLVDMMEAVCQVKEDVAKSYCEGDKVLVVYRGANKAGRFFEVSVYAKGDHKGFLWLLRVVLGGDGVVLRANCALCWFLPMARLVRRCPSLVWCQDCSFLRQSTHGLGSLQVALRIVLLWRSCNRSLESSWRIGRALRWRKARLLRGLLWKMAWMFLCWWLVLQEKWGQSHQILGQSATRVCSFRNGLGCYWAAWCLVNGPDEIPVKKQIRVVLKVLKGSKGFGAGPTSTTSYAGLGFPINSKRTKWPSRWVSPSVLKPPSSLLESKDLGALDAVPLKVSAICPFWVYYGGCFVDGFCAGEYFCPPCSLC
jgi:hypothetical protein